MTLVKLWFQEGFFFSFMAHQDYFTPFEPSQLVGKTKTGDLWVNRLQPNPQAEHS